MFLVHQIRQVSSQRLTSANLGVTVGYEMQLGCGRSVCLFGVCLVGLSGKMVGRSSGWGCWLVGWLVIRLVSSVFGWSDVKTIAF